VTTFGNGTYPSKIAAPEFSITWQYPPGPPTQPVHAFPNIKIDEEGVFPVQIGSISNIDIDSQWMYSVGDANQTTSVLDVGALSAVAANTNVAIDMFLDSDSSRSTSTENAKYEVMVWLATFGPATQPIGLDRGAKSVVTIGTTTFNLYFGVNGLGQTVLTWAAAAPVTDFVGNIAPLLQQDLSSFGGPTTSDYLGYVAFGSEALSAASNITLSVPRLSMQVIAK
jgi:Glycosyl hydrolase family 12